ncbi:MAG: hypothetical protein QOH56_822 [Pseudonocardiales bacterium]|nr:hypothetical protein [Pseudonocardiales bacterium]
MSQSVLRNEQVQGLVAVLDLVRAGTARTRPEILRESGLGRNVVTQRVSQLLDSGLLSEGKLGTSTGGRAPRELQYGADAGRILVAELGATQLRAGIANLAGELVVSRQEPCDIADGPETMLGRVDEIFRELYMQAGESVPIWGVGIGLPGPVEFASGRAVSPPIMPGWDRFPVREYLATRYDVPVWVDNDVNVMALGELRCGIGKGADEAVFVKVGTGVGAGLISRGRLHRGAQGCAGDIGHVAVTAPSSTVVCRCGRLGCLEALAGGAAIARDATQEATQGSSPWLRNLIDAGQVITAADVSRGATHGDRVSVDLLTASSHLVGDTLATIVNFFNPSLILLGGVVAEAGDMYLAGVRERVFSRSLPLATRDLRIVRSFLGDKAGMMGAACMVVDELMSPEILPFWIDAGSPAGRPELTGTMKPHHPSMASA